MAGRCCAPAGSTRRSPRPGRRCGSRPLDSFSGFYTATHGLALLGARALRRGAAVPAHRGRGLRRIFRPLQHADQLLRPSRPYRRGAGIHRAAQPHRAAAAAFRAAREPAAVRAPRRVHRGAAQGRRAGVGANYALPHTSCAVSTISRSFAISCSIVMVLPPMPLSKPHCGLKASCSSGAKRAAWSMRRLSSSLTRAARSWS